MRVIHGIVAGLPEFSKAEIQKMQVQYAILGIMPSDYDTALFAFLMTLEKKAYKTWSNDSRESWVFVFASIRHCVDWRQREGAMTIT
jgi:hypothetical protein